jgi:pyruvate,water dikinase
MYNSRALVELAIPAAGVTPDPSYGTHFFQDLIETHIFPLAIYPEEPGDYVNQEFLERADNSLAALLPQDADYGDCLQVICVPQECGGCHLEIVMDGEQALAYLYDESQATVAESLARSRTADEEPENPFYGW